MNEFFLNSRVVQLCAFTRESKILTSKMFLVGASYLSFFNNNSVFCGQECRRLIILLLWSNFSVYRQKMPPKFSRAFGARFTSLDSIFGRFREIQEANFTEPSYPKIFSWKKSKASMPLFNACH